MILRPEGRDANKRPPSETARFAGRVHPRPGTHRWDLWALRKGGQKLPVPGGIRKGAERQVPRAQVGQARFGAGLERTCPLQLELQLGLLSTHPKHRLCRLVCVPHSFCVTNKRFCMFLCFNPRAYVGS